MKKQLLAGTAFVAAAMLVAGGAMAQDKMKKKMMKPSISVNGYSEAVVGGILDESLGVGESDTSALDVRTDAEIHFNGRATLDRRHEDPRPGRARGHGPPLRSRHRSTSISCRSRARSARSSWAAPAVRR